MPIGTGFGRSTRSLRATVVASAWRRPTRRIPRASRLGIAARLSIAFSVVAILTVAANQIAEHGSSLIRVMAAAPVVSPPLDDRTAESLPTALDQFQRAVLARVESTAAPRDKAEAERGRRTRRSPGRAIWDALRPTIGDDVLRGLEGQVSAHSALGAQLVRSSDARRRLPRRARHRASVARQPREVLARPGLGRVRQGDRSGRPGRGQPDAG